MLILVDTVMHLQIITIAATGIWVITAQVRVQKACHRIVLHIVHQDPQVPDRTPLEEDHREEDKD
jgi:hypothetical protein